MAIHTITEPSLDEQQVRIYNTMMRQSNQKTLLTDQKYAVCLIRLHPAVNQPTDYATLKVAIEAVRGVQEIALLIDGQTPALIAEDKELRMVVDAHLRIDVAPEA